MKKFSIIIGALLLILLALAIYVSINKEKIAEDPIVDSSNEEQQVEEIDESNLKSLVVKHQYKDGKHILRADIEAPTSCSGVESIVSETNDPNLSRIDVKIVQDGENCAQVITNVTFAAEFEGPETLKYEIYVDGEKRRLNIFDVAPEVDINEFELFIKG